MSAAPDQVTTGKPDHLPPFATRPVLALAAGVGVVLLATAGRIGFAGDEYYFISAGRHLDWGYADQPPLLPLLALMMDTVFPGSVTAIRLPSIVLTVLGIVLSALLARELGGHRRAQLIAAGAFVSSLLTWYQAVTLSTAVFDTFLTTLTLWLLVRWVRVRQDRFLLFAGLTTAVALQVKYLSPILWLAIGIAAIAVGPRDLVRRPLLWVAAVFTMLTAIPGVLWQAGHGWVQLEVSQAIAAEQSTFLGGRLTHLPIVLLLAGLVTGAALAVYGLVRLLRAPELRAYRFLGWACLGLLVFFWLANGRSYYVGGFFPLLWAVAGVQLQVRQPARWWRWVPAWPTFVVSALVPVLLLVPLYPSSWLRLNPVFAAEMGWREFADDVARVQHESPERPAAVLTKFYPQAAALEFYRAESGLAPVYSGHRGAWYFGRPAADVRAVVAVGLDEQYLRERFGTVRRVDRVSNPYGNPVIGDADVWVCSDPLAPWPQLWPRLRTMGYG